MTPIDPQLDLVEEPGTSGRLHSLRELEKRVLWLSSWMIHHANHVRPNLDGLKVGGHQASSASVITILTALYFEILDACDRVAVKPHASPAFHAIQYLLGNQSRAGLEKFRGLGGAQSYPSRTKDEDDVDFSTGSVGLGVAMSSFAGLTKEYLNAKGWLRSRHRNARMVAVVGDAELDEGNVYEALLEGWKHDVRDVWWVIDYNRQSLDAVISDRLFTRFTRLFTSMGWQVITIKYGKRLQAAFERPGGEALRQWIDACPNSLYSALVVKGGDAWRSHLEQDIGARDGVKALLDDYDDDTLEGLMTNLGGHDMECVVEAFESVTDSQPTCFMAYTIKGYGLPLAGHKDNHSGLMSQTQMDALKRELQIPDGEEWAPFVGNDSETAKLRQFVEGSAFAQLKQRQLQAPPVEVSDQLTTPSGDALATQNAFGRILDGIARAGGPLADHIVTTSPDVTVSTGLGGWVNRRGVFRAEPQADMFSLENVGSFQQWQASPKGQHLELGIAENNLFVLLAALGLSHALFGRRLIPIGTVYDPFIERGLNALNYACYQGARFILVATPSGLTLAPEGGAHQSIGTPLIGLTQDGLAAFEPAFADELAVMLRWSFDYLQREGNSQDVDDLLDDAAGGSVYLRLSTRKIDQEKRDMTASLVSSVLAGGYWLREPGIGSELAIVYSGALAPEAIAAHARVAQTHPDCGLLAVTSGDRLFRGWCAARRRAGAVSHVEDLLRPLSPRAKLVTVMDAHPATLSWLGGVRGQRVCPLGVERFGQSGSIDELYHLYGIDTDAIVAAAIND